MDLASKWSDRARSGASSARCLSGLHFRVWRLAVSMTAVTVECDEKIISEECANLTHRRRRGWTREWLWLCSLDQKPKHEHQFPKTERRHPSGDGVFVLWQQ